MYDSFENNNDNSDVGISDNFISTQEVQTGTDQALVGVTSGDSSMPDDDSSDYLSIFQVNDNGYLLVNDSDLYQLVTEFKDNFQLHSDTLISSINNLDKDIRILTGVILIFAFGFFMRLLIRRIFGRWLN